MRFVGEMIRWQTLSGISTKVGEVSLTPVSQALTIRFPGGGLVWNRPVAVVVEYDGERTRLPVVDVTRIAVLALFGLSLAILVATVVLPARRRRV
jgi:hypothetical protein